jgi:hypothetical protein
MKSLTLKEGITGWANAGEDYIAHMEEYEAAPWTAIKED